MKDWSTDKIAVAGMVAALLVSIIAGAWTGREDTLAASIVTGIFGYIRGAAESKKTAAENQNSGKVPTALEKVATTATEAQKVVDAVNNIKDIVKK